MGGYVKKEDVIKYIEGIKCNQSIPNMALDILQHIREMPEYDLDHVLDHVIEQLDAKANECDVKAMEADYQYQHADYTSKSIAYRNTIAILKSTANTMNGGREYDID